MFKTKECNRIQIALFIKKNFFVKQMIKDGPKKVKITLPNVPLAFLSMNLE